MLLLANTLSWGMFLVGIALATTILIRRWHRYYYKQKRRATGSARETARKSATHIRSLSEAPDEILRWQVEMHETARVLKGELDSKMRLLQILIRQARDEADRLENLMPRHQNMTQEPDQPFNCPSSPPDYSAEILRLAGQGISSAQIAEHVGLPIGDVELILSIRKTR